MNNHVNVSLRAVTAICELLSRPNIPVGRQLIDRQLNRKKDRHIAEELSGALLFLLANMLLGRHTQADEINFWLVSRGEATDANDNVLKLKLGLERDTTFSIVTDVVRHLVPAYVMELDMVKEAFVAIGSIPPTVAHKAAIASPAPQPVQQAQQQQRPPAPAPADMQPPAARTPLLTLDKALKAFFQAREGVSVTENTIRNYLIDTGYGNRMTQFRTRLALVVSRDPAITFQGGMYTYTPQTQKEWPTEKSVSDPEETVKIAAPAPAPTPPVINKKDDWRTPTTYLRRFGDAMQLLCQGHRPSDELMTAWLDNSSEELQHFAAEHCPMWAQGIGTIDAARCTADQPTEGVEHEMFEEPKAAEMVEDEVEFVDEAEIEWDGTTTLKLSHNDTLACTDDGEFLICNADGKQIFSAQGAEAKRLANFVNNTYHCYD